MKSKFRTIVTILVTLALFSSLFTVSFAVEVAEAKPESMAQNAQLLPDRSTLPDSELSLQALAQLSGIQLFSIRSDEEQIEELLRLLFALKCDQFASCNYADFDFSLFWAKEPLKVDNLTYFQRCVEAEKWTHYVTDSTPLWCDSELSNVTITCNGDTASASVYQWISYQYPGADYTSGFGIPYNISLVNESGQWKISDIVFYDDASESLRDLSYTVEELLRSRQDEVVEASLGMPETIPPDSVNASIITSEYFTALNTSKVVTYASQYAKNYNTNFYNWASGGGDCQNFASQCIWSGLGGVNNQASISQKAWPMVTTAGWDWYATKTTDSTPSWRGCNSFGTFIQGNSMSVDTVKNGPIATVYSGIANAQVGDLIQYSEGRNGTYDHTYVVTAVTGTYGQRTAANITVCAHTSDRANDPFTYCYTSNFSYRTIHVFGNWYKFDQAPGSEIM